MPNKCINKVFNALFFLYLFLDRIIKLLFTPKSHDKVPWDAVFERSWPVSILGALLIVLLMVTCGALIVRAFWNRFVADMFKVRAISFDEAMAIVLMIAIVSR
jgi:hypothetical protein